MSGPLFLDLDTAIDVVFGGSVSKEKLKGAIAKGTLRAKRTGDGGGGKYLVSVAACEAWFASLEDA